MFRHIFTIVVALVLYLPTNIVYAGFDTSEVVDALQKLPYLYDFIQNFIMPNLAISTTVIKISFVLIELILGIIILSLDNLFICQEAVTISKNTKKVLSFGFLSYITIVTLLILFFSTLVGFPIGIVILIVAIIFILFGKISLGIYIGYFIENRLNLNWHTYLDYIIGTIIMGSLGFIPYVGVISNVCIIPVVSIGTIIMSLLNKFVYKVYYSIPFKQPKFLKKYERKYIRDIVVNGIVEEDNSYEKKC